MWPHEREREQRLVIRLVEVCHEKEGGKEKGLVMALV